MRLTPVELVDDDRLLESQIGDLALEFDQAIGELSDVSAVSQHGFIVWARCDTIDRRARDPRARMHARADDLPSMTSQVPLAKRATALLPGLRAAVIISFARHVPVAVVSRIRRRRVGDGEPSNMP